MSGSIKASFIIAAYEAADCIGAAISACLAQTEPSFEVIVVDDASAVSLEPAVRDAANGDPRVRFIRLEQNSGPSGARNAALAAARGDYVAVLDADDTMLPDRLATLLEVAQGQDADIVVDNMLANRVDEPQRSGPFLDPASLAGHRLVDLATYIDPATDVRMGQSLGYLKPLIRRACLDRLGLGYDTSLTNSEDYYFVAEMLARGAKMILTPYVGYHYTVQVGSISHRLNPHQTAAIMVAEQAFQDRHLATSSAQVKRVARARMNLLRRSHEFETLIDDLRRKSPLRFAMHLLASTINAPLHIGRLIAIAFRRVRRNGD